MAILLALPLAHAQYGIKTVAGGGPNNVPAVSASLAGPYGLAIDSNGNTYISAYFGGQIYKVSPGGTLTTFAGSGYCGFSGDGGPAILASLCGPRGLSFDGSGNLYVADSLNHRVRRIDGTTGIISTVAGGGNGQLGDEGAATSATLEDPSGIVAEADGTFYVADDFADRVRKVDAATGTITTYAGGYLCCSGTIGDGGPAYGAKLDNPEGLALDAAGNLYIADTAYGRIRKVTKATGIISTVAGSTIGQNAGDNGPATSAVLQNPRGVAVAANGDIYIGTTRHIRKVSGGIITSIAGNAGAFPQINVEPLSDAAIGSGGQALSALITNVSQLVLDNSGNIVFSDSELIRVRRISGGTISAFAGNGWLRKGGDGNPAVSASLYQPLGVAIGTSGQLVIADTGNQTIRQVTSNGYIDTIVGNGNSGNTPANNSGNGGPALQARLNEPPAVAFTNGGDIVIAEPNNYRIRQVTSGIINSIAGTGYQMGILGTGDGTATGAGLYGSYGVATDPYGNIFITDGDRVRVIANGTITTIAGGGCGDSGDGGPAAAAKLCNLQGLAYDNNALYVADSGFHRVRKISGLPSTQITGSCGTCTISAVAGTGSNGFSGDGGAATSAQLFYPTGLAVDSSHNLYIADKGNQRIRMVSNGVISTVAGNGTKGFSGDGYAATTASLADPTGVAVGFDGTIYVADSQNHRIRALTSGVVSVTVTSSPAGLAVVVDGTTYAGPQSFSWAAGSNHTIATVSQQTSGGTRNLFSAWSDGGALSHTVSAPASSTTYTASFNTQYFLTTSSNQPALGSVAPASGWFNAGSSVAVTATANAGNVFTGFSGALSGTTNPQNVTMNAPNTVSGSFAALVTTVTTLPAGLNIVVDGVTYAAPHNFTWVAGSNHTIAVPSGAQFNGVSTRYTFQTWSDAGAATHTVQGPALPTTFTANFLTEYRVGTTISPANAGTVAGSGWYLPGTTAILTATANTGYAFANFSGFPGGPSATNPLSLPVNGPLTVAANFTALAPALSASLSTKNWDAGTATESLTIKLQNSGLGNAVNASITSMTATVFQGAGVLGAPSPASQVLGTIAPGGNLDSATITIPTPSTVIRIKLVVNYTSAGGAPGSTTLIFFK